MDLSLSAQLDDAFLFATKDSRYKKAMLSQGNRAMPL